MFPLEFDTAIWFLTALQALGLASAWLARVSEGSRFQAACQSLFLLCLCLLGVATAAALTIGPGSCMSCGLTLSIMCVGVICDFQGARHAETA